MRETRAPAGARMSVSQWSGAPSQRRTTRERPTNGGLGARAGSTGRDGVPALLSRGVVPGRCGVVVSTMNGAWTRTLTEGSTREEKGVGCIALPIPVRTVIYPGRLIGRVCVSGRGD